MSARKGRLDYVIFKGLFQTKLLWFCASSSKVKFLPHISISDEQQDTYRLSATPADAAAHLVRAEMLPEERRQPVGHMAWSVRACGCPTSSCVSFTGGSASPIKGSEGPRASIKSDVS